MSTAGTTVAEPIYFTRDLRNASSSLTLIDHDNDYNITYVDVATSLALQLVATDYTNVDADNDGQLTANDTLVQIEGIIRASVRDLDGDGVVGPSDATQLLNAISNGDEVNAADVDLDSVLTNQDFTNIITHFGDSNAVDSAAAAQFYFNFVDGPIARILDPNDTFASRPAIAAAELDDNFPFDDSHYIRTSQNYPRDHAKDASNLYPGNHQLSVSATWGEPDCNWLGLNCEYRDGTPFPANHTLSTSQTWDDAGHNVSTSDENWGHAPEHRYTVSSTWEHPGSVHDLEVSRRWTTNHNGHVSLSDPSFLPNPDGHYIDITGDWQFRSHNQETSDAWPPSHMLGVSNGWANHVLAWSVSWPANHTASTSSSWPAGHYPNWPANHSGPITKAERDQGPAIDPGWFPAGHARFYSLRDILGLPNDLIDLPWPWGLVDIYDGPTDDNDDGVGNDGNTDD